MKVLILAGGFATRLWPLTENRAKPLLKLEGKTILKHILEKIPQDLEIIILTNQRFEKDFQKEIEKVKPHKIEIFLEDAFSENEKLGALGAISACIDHFQIQEDLIILAGDNVLPEFKIKNLYHDSESAVMAVWSVKDLYQARKFGVVEIENSTTKNTRKKVVHFEEKPKNPKSTLVSTGCLFLGKNLLPFLQDFAQKQPDALGGIFPFFLRQKKNVWATQVPGHWFDIGSFETYLEAHKKLKTEKNLIKAPLKNTKTKGKVYIEPQCEIEDCTIIDSIIYGHTKLKNCYIANTVIDKNCDLANVDLCGKLIRKNLKFHG